MCVCVIVCGGDDFLKSTSRISISQYWLRASRPLKLVLVSISLSSFRTRCDRCDGGLSQGGETVVLYAHHHWSGDTDEMTNDVPTTRKQKSFENVKKNEEVKGLKEQIGRNDNYRNRIINLLIITKS